MNEELEKKLNACETTHGIIIELLKHIVGQLDQILRKDSNLDLKRKR